MSTKLFIGNLSWKLRNSDLEDIFAEFGTVTDAVIIMERENPNRSRGFGFVTFDDEASAENAIAEMHEKEVDGRNMIVNVAQPRD